MIPEHLEVPIAGGLDFPLPRMTRVRQKFTVVREPDLAAAVKREIAGTAVIIPIQAASMPTAFSHTGKNGRCVPNKPKAEA